VKNRHWRSKEEPMQDVQSELLQDRSRMVPTPKRTPEPSFAHALRQSGVVFAPESILV